MVKTGIGVNSRGSGTCDEDASLTRDQALERFGIDLGRVGVMTSARTARNGGVGNSSDRGLDQGPSAAGIDSSTAGGIGREKEDIKVRRTRNRRGRAGSFTTTTEDSRDAVAKRQELLSEKLRVLDKLLSDEPLCVAPVEEDEKDKGEQEADFNSQPGEDDPVLVVPEEKSIVKSKTTTDFVPDLSSGGVAGRGDTPDVWSLGKTTSSQELVAKNSVRLCGELQSKTPTGAFTPEPEPNQLTTTADAVHSSHGKEEGRGDPGAATDMNEDVLLGNTPETDVVEKWRCHVYEKALPNHR